MSQRHIQAAERYFLRSVTIKDATMKAVYERIMWAYLIQAVI